MVGPVDPLPRSESDKADSLDRSPRPPQSPALVPSEPELLAAKPSTASDNLSSPRSSESARSNSESTSSPHAAPQEGRWTKWGVVIALVSALIAFVGIAPIITIWLGEEPYEELEFLVEPEFLYLDSSDTNRVLNKLALEPRVEEKSGKEGEQKFEEARVEKDWEIFARYKANKRHFAYFFVKTKAGKEFQRLAESSNTGLAPEDMYWIGVEGLNWIPGQEHSGYSLGAAEWAQIAVVISEEKLDESFDPTKFIVEIRRRSPPSTATQAPGVVVKGKGVELLRTAK